MNIISFMVIGLEKYFCRAVADAEARIRDPAILEEARLFRIQEAVHSQAHKLHVSALIKKYPGLKAAVDLAVESFDALYEQHDLRFHLAYAGGLEASFTPSFKLLIDHRDTLFAGGDARVASLFLWHFCEEIEHRSSAITVYNHLYGDHLYRLANVRAFYKHSRRLGEALRAEFQKHVPNVPAEAYADKPLKAVPGQAKLRSLFGILASQMPWHDPEHAALPDYYAEWRRRYEAGEDMRLTYGVLPAAA
jgi:hypothetical protein